MMDQCTKGHAIIPGTGEVGDIDILQGETKSEWNGMLVAYDAKQIPPTWSFFGFIYLANQCLEIAEGSL